MIKILFLFLLLTSFVKAGTRDPNTPDEKYVEYGKKYKCVVKILNKMNDENDSFGSAVIIKPKWALTAAHVVRGTVSNKILLDDETEINIEQIFVPKEFDKEFGYYDIAVCKLDKNIELDFYPDLYSDNDEVGKIAGISGFGVTGTFSSKERVSSKIRRAGSNKIDNIEKHLLICTPSMQNRTELEFLIYHGDSGGGLFIDKKLAGINSCVLASDKNPNASYGDEGGHTRISIHREWINNTIEKNE